VQAFSSEFTNFDPRASCEKSRLLWNNAAMANSVTVGASRINGTGVFAASRFASGDVVLAIDDSHAVDAGHPVPPGEEHHCDCLEHGRTVWMQPPERYINHSCDPNVYVRTVDSVRQVVAIREIDTEEEIAYDLLHQQLRRYRLDLPLRSRPLPAYHPFRFLPSAAGTSEGVSTPA
jgi:hypothetical protein